MSAKISFYLTAAKKLKNSTRVFPNEELNCAPSLISSEERINPSFSSDKVTDLRLVGLAVDQKEEWNQDNSPPTVDCDSDHKVQGIRQAYAYGSPEG